MKLPIRARVHLFLFQWMLWPSMWGCWVGRHDPAEFYVRQGRMRDIQEGLVPATCEFRCSRCFVELDRP